MGVSVGFGVRVGLAVGVGAPAFHVAMSGTATSSECASICSGDRVPQEADKRLVSVSRLARARIVFLLTFLLIALYLLAVQRTTPFSHSMIGADEGELPVE